MVTAPSAGLSGAGAVYVYERPAGGWRTMFERAVLSPSDGRLGDQFGYSVTIHSGDIVVGSPYANIGNNSSQGAVYIFRKPPEGWKNAFETEKVSFSVNRANDRFGNSVCSGGSEEDGLVVGISGYDFPESDSGTAVVLTSYNSIPSTSKYVNFVFGGSHHLTLQEPNRGLLTTLTSLSGYSDGFTMDVLNRKVVFTAETPSGPTTLTGPASGIYRVDPATLGITTLAGPNSMVFHSPGKILVNQDGDYVFTNGTLTPSGLEYKLLKLSRHGSAVTTILSSTALGRKTSFSGPISIDIDTGCYLVADQVNTSTLKYPVLRVDDQGNVTTFCTGQSQAGGWRLPWSLPQDHRTGSLVGPYGSFIYEVGPGSSGCTTLSTVSASVLEAVKFNLQTGPIQHWVASNGVGTYQYLYFIERNTGTVTSIGVGQKNFSRDIAFYQSRHTQTLKMAPHKWQILLSAPDFPGKNYALVASISGVRPGIALPDGRNININLDQALLLTLYNMMPALWNSGPGRLDANGEARGTLDLSYFGRLDLPLWIAWLVLDPMAPGGIAFIPDTYVMRI